MTLLEGQVLRFKGRHAKTHCDDVAKELHDRCTRDGNTLKVTQNTRLRIDPKLKPGARNVLDFEIEPGSAATENGAHDGE